jgi:hypothetical protein
MIQNMQSVLDSLALQQAADTGSFVISGSTGPQGNYGQLFDGGSSVVPGSTFGAAPAFTDTSFTWQPEPEGAGSA